MIETAVADMLFPNGLIARRGKIVYHSFRGSDRITGHAIIIYRIAKNKETITSGN
jgi:hypothetical protein